MAEDSQEVAAADSKSRVPFRVYVYVTGFGISQNSADYKQQVRSGMWSSSITIRAQLDQHYLPLPVWRALGYLNNRSVACLWAVWML